MLNLIYYNNVARTKVAEITLDSLKAQHDIVNFIFNEFRKNKIDVICDTNKLLIDIKGNMFDFDTEFLCDASAVIYNDVIAIANEKKFDDVNGIYYFFHTSEKIHWYEPHIHASNSGDEIKVNLKDFSVEGKLNKKKQNEAVNFIKANVDDIRNMWNEIMTALGGPIWED